jgi:hypothetical protein
MLTKTNYIEWSMVMKVKMLAQHMWDAVRYGNTDFARVGGCWRPFLLLFRQRWRPLSRTRRLPSAKYAWDTIVNNMHQQQPRPQSHTA